MNPKFKQRFIIASSLLMAVPFTVLAQQDRNEVKNKKEDVQQITIIRKGNTDEKTVVEIKGDQVKVNGKDVKDDKNDEVTVQVNKFKGMDNLSRLPEDLQRRDYALQQRNMVLQRRNIEKLQRRNQDQNMNFDFNMDMNNDGVSLFSEDQNRAMLGVVTDQNDKGAEIAEVSEGSAAVKAGLKKGDVITKIDDKKIEGAEDVANIVHTHKPGDKVTINYIRNGKDQKTTAELGKWKGIRFNGGNFRTMDPKVWQEPATPNVPNPPATFDFRGNGFQFNDRPKLGLSIQDTEDGKGVKVIDVDEDSNAAKAGVKEDDVITQVNDKDVNSADEISRIVKENKDKTSISLKIQRNGKPQTIEVRMPHKINTVDL